MNQQGMKSVWGTEEESVEDFYSTKFLELLVKYDYVWSGEEKETREINLGPKEIVKFLHDFGEFVEGFNEMQASQVICNIREIYNKEYYRLLKASSNIYESRFPWFSEAHKLFRETMIKESSEGNFTSENTGNISSENLPDLELKPYIDPLSPIFVDIADYDPMSPPSEISDDDIDPLSPIFVDIADYDLMSPPSEISADEDSSPSKTGAVTGEIKLLKTAEVSESSQIEIQSFVNSDSLSSRHQAKDEAFIDDDSVPSFTEVTAEDYWLIATEEKITPHVSLPQKEKSFNNTTFRFPVDKISLASGDTSISPAAITIHSSTATTSFLPMASHYPSVKTSVSPDARTCVSPAARTSVSPEVRTCVSPDTTFFISPTASVSPTSRISISPATRTFISPTSRASLFLGFKRTLSSSHESNTSPVKQQKCNMIRQSENTSSLKIVKDRNQTIRTFPSPAARTFPSPAARTFLSPSERSLSQVFKRTLPNSQESTLPMKQQRYNEIEESENMKSMKKSRESRTRSLTYPQEKLQPLFNLVMPIHSGDEIIYYPTYSGTLSVLHSLKHTKDLPGPIGEVTDHSSISNSPRETETVCRKEQAAPRSLFYHHKTRDSNLPGSFGAMTKTDERHELKNSEDKNIVQYAASLAITRIKRLPELSRTEDVRGADTSITFANRAISVLSLLPPSLALVCEIFIMHFLHETSKCSY